MPFFDPRWYNWNADMGGDMYSNVIDLLDRAKEKFILEISIIATFLYASQNVQHF